MTVSSAIPRLQYGAVVSTSPALFAGLLDDAAMFPPGNASPQAAVAGHLRYRNAWYADLVGPLLVADGRWAEVARAHAEADSPVLEVAVIGTATPPEPVPAGLRIAGFELSVAELPLPDPGPTFQLACELTAATDRGKLLTAIAERRTEGQRVIAKYRTGGTSAAAFPSEREVADVITEAARVDVPLKFTAGLHSAVRFTDAETGFEHHGFLNLLVAVALARRGADRSAVLGAVAERRADAVAAEVGSWSPAEVGNARAGFRSFGCCGVEDPVADLVALGLLGRQGP